MIVMDLEWNHGTVDKQLLLEGRTLRFEIIQIGAVQVDSLGNICKTFERLVMPCVHRTIMPKVIELTGITDRNLKGQQGFVQVWQDFCRWAGEEKRIVFWGNCVLPHGMYKIPLNYYPTFYIIAYYFIFCDS